MMIVANGMPRKGRGAFFWTVTPTLAATFVIVCVFSRSARAETADDRIYQAALGMIVGHEQPKALAISAQPIGRTAMTSSRVPRHDPYDQFKRALPGMSGKLEQALIAGAAEGDEKNGINAINVSYPGVAFLGFMRYAAIKQFEKSAGNGVAVVGFSKIAYDDSRRNALLYTESCLIGHRDTCSGEGFWLEDAAPGWRVKRHAYLWAGSNQPFWNIQ
jgi:hypothetical protein